MNKNSDDLNMKLNNFGYIPSKEIDTVIQLALYLEKPLLIEGPPGTGKTSLAISVSKALGLELIRIQCYEGIDSIQIIGEFNYKKQLLQLQKNQIDKKESENIFSEDFFIPRPLYKAFTSKERVVLLIDELDAADEEFTAFLLEALGEGQITIPEFGTIKSNKLPYVFLTSNNRQDLPEALRRRCLYIYIDYPNKEREEEIIRFHCETEDNLLHNLVRIVHEIRGLEIRKKPSISESIDWMKSLMMLKVEEITPEIMDQTISVIIKHQEDINVVKEKISEIISQ
ncbi:MAG: AAA family ATPase [Candidatus Hodarchaeales archaeon]|jgi:MoxR-like ATPase